MHKQHKKILFGCAVFFAVVSAVHAQTAGSLPDPVQYIVAPQTPGPNQVVQIQAQGVGTFLGSATITWSRNGKVAAQGVGLRDFSFTTGALGVETDIHVSISSPQGTYTHDFVFLPSAINLVWEADTSVPPLYRSKSLYSAGSTIKVVAFPTVIVRGSRVAASALTYQWSVNDQAVTNQSGLGRTNITVVGDQLQPQETIAVDVFFGNSKIGHGEIVIPITETALVFYYKDPLRGVLWDIALPNAISLSGKEITIDAVPYFFANNSKNNGSLTYTWTLDNNEITGPDTARGLLTLRQTGSGAGAAVLGVSLQNNDPDKFVQTAKTAMQIIFGQSSGTSLFGI